MNALQMALMRFGKLGASDRLRMPTCEAFPSEQGGRFPHGKGHSYGFAPDFVKTRIETMFPDPLQEDISMLVE